MDDKMRFAGEDSRETNQTTKGNRQERSIKFAGMDAADDFGAVEIARVQPHIRPAPRADSKRAGPVYSAVQEHGTAVPRGEHQNALTATAPEMGASSRSSAPLLPLPPRCSSTALTRAAPGLQASRWAPRMPTGRSGSASAPPPAPASSTTVGSCSRTSRCAPAAAPCQRPARRPPTGCSTRVQASVDTAPEHSRSACAKKPFAEVLLRGVGGDSQPRRPAQYASHGPPPNEDRGVPHTFIGRCVPWRPTEPTPTHRGMLCYGPGSHS